MKKDLIIEKSWCKRCGICVEFCPCKVLELDDGGVYINDISKCIFCKQCEERCPDYAIYINDIREV